MSTGYLNTGGVVVYQDTGLEGVIKEVFFFFSYCFAVCFKWVSTAHLLWFGRAVAVIQVPVSVGCMGLRR